jgi:hypothetical protein
MIIPRNLDVVTTFELTSDEEMEDGSRRITYAAKNVADEETPLTMTVNVSAETMASEGSIENLLLDMAATELVPFAVAHIMAMEANDGGS